MIDLAVLGQDPRFGGGGLAQMEAFLTSALELGRMPELLYAEHPTLAGRLLTIDRVEVLRQLRAEPRLRKRIAGARSTWAVATIATHGLAAPRSGQAYGCWLGTSLADEWAGRGRSLDRARRLAQDVNAPFLRPIERSVIRGAAAVYATSPGSRRAVAAAGGLDESAVGILPLPVDVERFVPEPDETWIARLEAPTIAFVGRSDDPRKNLALLLDALPRIPARLLLIGRPPARIPAGVEAVGEVADVAAALRSASLLVLPSWQEGFGIVAAEALASGVPVVTTPSGGPEHLVRESGGGRVLSGFDSGELAAVVSELLEAPDTLRSMRSAGREHVVREHSPARFRALLADALAAVDAA